ncbi:amidohydrolase family protein [Microbacterium kyungheense]|uniref:Putative TIM-barrel fold metal-dependent hydrolase n=1 Tax=Microbacterium kyungheense TaxID=1263636 RepID=A0A543EDU2_9MICO|nr:amidohydrolase family protein [Microbacterium kyungheense]TQM19649.1 putative TIM-barrel fold metal-dependent hydrolase [Microbacterium kyungheense]TQM27323.1 putative TIM-barrel fold metal-dependent hydrolase [Microbacterium kyungheense]
MISRARALLAGFGELGAIDTTCHLGQWPYRLAAWADADRLRAYARGHGLQALWVSHLATLTGFDTRTGNEALRRACGEDPLFRLFAVVDPAAPTWRRELSWAADAGFAGVRLAPGDHGTAPAALGPVLHEAAEHGLPVQILFRLDDPRVRHPRSPARDPQIHELADVVREAPAHPLVLSGLNRLDALELSRHLGDEVPAHVLLDLWHVNGPTFVGDTWGSEPERWVFGSGFPVQTPEATMLQIVAAELDEAARARIVRGNAAAIVP